MIAVNHSTRSRPQLEDTCLLCGQPLSGEATTGLLLNTPLCWHERGLLPTFLEAYGLSGFERGIRVFPTRRRGGTTYLPPLFMRL